MYRPSSMILAPGAVVAIACMAAAAPLHDAPDLMPVKMLAPPQHPPVELVRQGQPRAVVHVAAASPALDKLVLELIEVVRLSTGAELKVVAQAPAADQPAIVIGDCAESRQAGIDATTLPIEGFVVKTAPARIYLVGSTAPLPPTGGGDPCLNEGTAWAVADFLERFVGVRWYWPAQFGGRSVVKAADIVVPPAHYADAPAFRKRSHWPPFYDRWASRWSDKTQPPPPESAGGTGRIEMGQLLACLRSGNSWPYLIKVHQPQWWPEDQWQAANAKYPTMFAVNADGTRSKALLCYSSKDTLAYLLEGCETSWDKGKPGAVPWVTEQCLSISPGDAPIDCRCPECQKALDPEAPWHGAAGSAASRLLGRFVKSACEAVKDRWPSKKVIYLPYWNYALCPTEIDFPDNLEIEFATTGFAGLRQKQLFADVTQDSRAWAGKTASGKITTWEYSCWITGWSHAAVQFPHLVQSYYRTNRDVLAGSFVNGEAFAEWTKCAPTLYVWMRVLWNPDIDVDATLDEMCTRLYGKGAKTARELLRLQCERWENADIVPWSEPLGVAGKFSPAVYLETWPPDVGKRMDELRRKAAKEMQGDGESLRRFEFWTYGFDQFMNEWKEFATIFDLPRLDGVVVDGADADWGGKGFRVEGLLDPSGSVKPVPGLAADFRLGWDEKGLLVRAEVKADGFQEAEKETELFTGDCVELLLNQRVGSMDRVRVVVAPGLDPKHPEPRVWTQDLRSKAALRNVPVTVEVKRTKIDGGYLLEARLPWAMVGLEPQAGLEVAVQVSATRKQPDGTLTPVIWHREAGGSPHGFHRVRLAGN